jgi:hypothetical protein
VVKLILGLGAALVLSACMQADHPSHGLPVCEESRNVHCLTPTVCDYDPARGCQVCRCGPPPYRPYPGGPDGSEIVQPTGSSTPGPVGAALPPSK